MAGPPLAAAQCRLRRYVLMRAGEPLSEVEAEQMMKEADKDGDGTIDYEGAWGMGLGARRPGRARLLTCPSALRVRGHDDWGVLQAGPVGAATAAVGSPLPAAHPAIHPMPAPWPINAPARLVCASLSQGWKKGMQKRERVLLSYPSHLGHHFCGTPDTAYSPALGSGHQPEGQAGHRLRTTYSHCLPALGGGCPRAPPGALSSIRRSLR